MADLDVITQAQFWSRVTCRGPHQCWLWRGATRNGYGRWRKANAHRIAYELVHGQIPEGLLVRHKCDVRACCNPHHLEIGTCGDNMADCVERGRIAAGAKNGHTTLREDQIAAIRLNYEQLNGRELAEKYGVAQSTISYIRSGRSWKYASP